MERVTKKKGRIACFQHRSLFENKRGSGHVETPALDRSSIFDLLFINVWVPNPVARLSG